MLQILTSDDIHSTSHRIQFSVAISLVIGFTFSLLQLVIGFI